MVVDMTHYESLCEFQNLYTAHKMARRGKQDKPDVISFELELGSNLWRLKNELEQRTYRAKPYYTFWVHDPKERKIDALHYADRVVQHSLCDNVLAPVLERRLIYDNAACRKSKGTHFALRRLTGFLVEHYKKHGAKGYVLKCDIAKYFDNIDHAVLKAKLKSAILDADILNLLYQIIDSYHPDTGKGIPLGNQTSQWFALYYLDPVDRLIKEKLRIKHYTRYMDDFLLIHESKDYLNHCKCEIEALLHDKLHLSFNAKTQIFPIKNGAEYLGWRFYLTDTGKVIKRLRTSAKKRFKRRLKSLQSAYAAGETELSDIKRSLASYHGHLKHGHTYRLRKAVYGSFVLRRDSTDIGNTQSNENE